MRNFEVEKLLDENAHLLNERDALKAENEVLLVTVRRQKEERDALKLVLSDVVMLLQGLVVTANQRIAQLPEEK